MTNAFSSKASAVRFGRYRVCEKAFLKNFRWVVKGVWMLLIFCLGVHTISTFYLKTSVLGAFLRWLLWRICWLIVIVPNKSTTIMIDFCQFSLKSLIRLSCLQVNLNNANRVLKTMCCALKDPGRTGTRGRLFLRHTTGMIHCFRVNRSDDGFIFFQETNMALRWVPEQTTFLNCSGRRFFWTCAKYSSDLEFKMKFKCKLKEFWRKV